MISECQRVFVLMSQRRIAVSSLTVHKMFDDGSELNLQAQTPAKINKDKLVSNTQPNTGIQETEQSSFFNRPLYLICKVSGSFMFA